MKSSHLSAAVWGTRFAWWHSPGLHRPRAGKHCVASRSQSAPPGLGSVCSYYYPSSSSIQLASVKWPPHQNRLGGASALRRGHQLTRANACLGSSGAGPPHSCRRGPAALKGLSRCANKAGTRLPQWGMFTSPAVQDTELLQQYISLLNDFSH